jgi:hypothetical protein
MIQVKHIVAYLQSLDQEAEVDLDKDGWMEEDCTNPESPEMVVRERGLFNYYRDGVGSDKAPYLVINN